MTKNDNLTYTFSKDKAAQLKELVDRNLHLIKKPNDKKGA